MHDCWKLDSMRCAQGINEITFQGSKTSPLDTVGCWMVGYWIHYICKHDATNGKRWQCQLEKFAFLCAFTIAYKSSHWSNWQQKKVRKLKLEFGWWCFYFSIIHRSLVERIKNRDRFYAQFFPTLFSLKHRPQRKMVRAEKKKLH